MKTTYRLIRKLPDDMKKWFPELKVWETFTVGAGGIPYTTYKDGDGNPYFEFVSESESPSPDPKTPTFIV